MSYEFYKILHVLMVVLMFSFFAVQIFSKNTDKKMGMYSGIASLVLFVSGFGLIARLGSGWPTWVLIKLGIWLVIAIGTPMVIKRMSAQKRPWFGLMSILLIVVLYLVQYKPGA